MDEFLSGKTVLKSRHYCTPKTILAINQVTVMFPRRSTMFFDLTRFVSEGNHSCYILRVPQNFLRQSQL